NVLLAPQAAVVLSVESTDVAAVHTAAVLDLSGERGPGLNVSAALETRVVDAGLAVDTNLGVAGAEALALDGRAAVSEGLPLDWRGEVRAGVNDAGLALSSGLSLNNEAGLALGGGLSLNDGGSVGLDISLEGRLIGPATGQDPNDFPPIDNLSLDIG